MIDFRLADMMKIEFVLLQRMQPNVRTRAPNESMNKLIEHIALIRM